MKRKGFCATVRNEAGKGVDAFSGASIFQLLLQMANSGKINTINERFIIEVEPFETGSDEGCDYCHLNLDLCNCGLIEPDPHPHLVLVSGTKH
jgi:hypothetical protein